MKYYFIPEIRVFLKNLINLDLKYFYKEKKLLQSTLKMLFRNEGSTLKHRVWILEGSLFFAGGGGDVKQVHVAHF